MRRFSSLIVTLNYQVDRKGEFQNLVINYLAWMEKQKRFSTFIFINCTNNESYVSLSKFVKETKTTT